MATDDNEQNPFTRPGFIAAAVLVALVVVLGIVIAIVNATRSDEPATAPEASSPSPTTSAAPTSEPPDAAGSASVCGLEGESLSGTLSTAPAADWAFQGTTAYPTSAEFGPGETTAEGVRFCFQHSPTGALFAASNALALGSDPVVAPAWIKYFAAEGPHREELLAETEGSASTAGTRLRVAGFRILSYDGETARIDLAGEGSTSAGSIYFSAVYELIWQDGDWKANTETAKSFDFATIPNLAGYTTWGA